MLSIGMTIFIFGGAVSIRWLYPAVAANFLASLLTIYPQTFFVIFVIMNHYLLLFKKVLVQYNQWNQALLRSSDSNNLTSFLNEGVEIVEALSLLDAVFGSVITTEITLCIMAELFGFYFGSTLFQAIVEGKVSVCLFVFIFVIFGLQGLFRYYMLTRNGQVVTNAMKECRANLKRMNILLAPLTPVQEKQMEMILSRFSEPVAWSPMDLFDLSQSSSMMVHSVIVTYLVVLIQFKGSE